VIETAGDGLPPLREVIAAHGLSARKALGQNFLLDLNLTRKIARSAGPLADCDVLEIGPGPGGLTRALLMEGARRIVAIERDPRCLGALSEIARAYPERLQVIEGDALNLDPTPWLDPPVRIVANLPYNVGTELLVRWLTPPAWPPFWTSMTLMFQKEVAERIVAAPGSKAYGRLSILAQWRSTPASFWKCRRGPSRPRPRSRARWCRSCASKSRAFPPNPMRFSAWSRQRSTSDGRCFGRACARFIPTSRRCWRLLAFVRPIGRSRCRSNPSVASAGHWRRAPKDRYHSYSILSRPSG
jgi:16S rRNA (adenine1518-N6/adenine1519-N6)-dimethyltransferase